MPRPKTKKPKTLRATPTEVAYPLTCPAPDCHRRFKAVGHLNMHLSRKHPSLPVIATHSAPAAFPTTIYMGMDSRGELDGTWFDHRDTASPRIAVYTLSLVVVKEGNRPDAR